MSPKPEVTALIDIGTLTATEALSKKLIDSILYPDELDKHLEKIYSDSISFLQKQNAYEPERPK